MSDRGGPRLYFGLHVVLFPFIEAPQHRSDGPRAQGWRRRVQNGRNLVMVGGSVTTVNEGVKKRGMGQEGRRSQEEVDLFLGPAVGSLVSSEGQ